MPVKYHLVLKKNPAKLADPKKYYAVAASGGDVKEKLGKFPKCRPFFLNMDIAF
jgi:hypothetical protein